ncbi:MAG: hypothetical protein KC435_03025 [Thermomicrobiales bacterium]|nr:hypothetical protein [Thermomicrobiales bacterium]
MNLLNRRRFVAVTSVAATSALLVACGNEQLTEEQLNPTQIPDVPGAPPTIAPKTATPGAEADSGSAGDATSPEASNVVEIHTLDTLKFDPAEVSVSPGQTIRVVNEGMLQHDLVCDDWGIETDLLNGGDSQDLTIPEDAEIGSTAEFHCSVAGHKEAGMVGKFTVVEASAAPAQEETPAEEPPATDAGVVEVHTLDTLKFDPAEVSVSPGQTVRVVNEGMLQHDLVCDDWGIKTDLLNGGDSQEITIPDDVEVGSTAEFHCSVAGHKEAGMTGKFTVVAAAAPAGEETPAEEAPAEEATAEETEAAPAGETTAAGEPLLIHALDTFKFDPKEANVSPGQTIKVVNDGFMQHDMVVDAWGVGTELLSSGDEGEFTVPADAEIGSTQEYYCTVAGHKQSGMFGTFTVVEGSAAPAGDAATEEAPAEGTAAAEATPAAENTVMAVTVVGTKWQFDPAEFDIAPGGVITFQNNTGMLMGLSSEEWDANALQPMIKSVADGDTGTFTVPEDANVGDVIEFKSNLSEAEKQGMVGKITIVAADGAAATPQGSSLAPETVAEAPADAIEVKMLDTFAFEPKDFEAAAGATIHFVNEGFMQHDAAVDAWSDEPLTPLLFNGESANVVVPDTVQAGEQYEYYCTVAGHKQSGMKGTITIK